MAISFCKEQLSLFKNYEFLATSTKEDGWKGSGKGGVKVEETVLNTLLFLKEGFFENSRGKFKSHNIYRWKFNQQENSISLEHLRFGAAKPVYLFDLVHQQDHVWLS